MILSKENLLWVCAGLLVANIGLSIGIALVASVPTLADATLMCTPITP